MSKSQNNKYNYYELLALMVAKAHACLLWATDVSLGRNIFLIFIPLLVIGYFSFLARNYQLDDALIYLRYVKNFHEGFGLVYNPGERFNGLTSPLFTYIVLAASFLFKNLQITTIIISSVFLTCACILGGKLFSKGKWEFLFTAVIIGSFGYFYSTFGMETPLFLMLIGLSLYLYKIDSKYFILALTFLILTRGEGVFLAVAIAADYLIRDRRLPNIKIMAIALVILLLPFVFNYFYYGDFLPATASAKIGQGKSGFWNSNFGFLNVAYLIDAVFSKSNLAALVLLIYAVYGVSISLKDRIAVISLIFSAMLLCFYIGLNLPNYQRYYAPLFYLMLIFACRGMWRLATSLLVKSQFGCRTLIFSILCGVTVFALTKVVSFKEGGRIEAYANIGSWIEKNTVSSASVAMVEIGTVGWYSNREIIDILGLVNKYNAGYISKGDLYGWLSRYQPDYILRHDPIWRLEQSTKILEANAAYLPVKEFNFPGYILLKKTDKYTDRVIANYFLEKSVNTSAIK